MSRWAYLGYAFVAGFFGLVAGFGSWALWAMWVAIRMVEGSPLAVGLSVGGLVAVCSFVVLCLINYGYTPRAK